MCSSPSTVSRETPEDGLPPYWIFYPALLVILLPFSENLRESASLPICGLIVGIAVPALLGIGFRAAGHNVASSVCGVFILACYWMPFGLLLLLFMTRSGALGYGMIIGVYVAVFAIPLWIFGLFATFSFARHVGLIWAMSAVLLAFFPAIILVGMGAEQRSQREQVNSRPRPADPIVLKDDFLKLNACLQDFARSRTTRGFPNSLALLRPEGNGCLSDELVKGVRRDFTIRYEPGQPSSDGSIASYWLSALETTPKAAPYSSTMHSDQSGMMWFRYDGPQGQGHPYLLYYPGTEFNKAENCAWEAAGTSWNVYENNLTRTVTDRDTFLKSCTQSLGNFGFEYGYTFSERPDGTAASFQLQIRPKTYGVTALRSYLAVGTYTDDGKPHTLTVHATPQDRAATEQDPLAIPEEVSMPAKLGVAEEQWCGRQLCDPSTP